MAFMVNVKGSGIAAVEYDENQSSCWSGTQQRRKLLLNDVPMDLLISFHTSTKTTDHCDPLRKFRIGHMPIDQLWSCAADHHLQTLRH
jgi:hypothetical protein